MALPPVIFANAMWRSGSTYLASRFAASDDYLLFYEPCHEAVGRSRNTPKRRNRKSASDLNHPELKGGYFGSYEWIDPVSHQPVTRFFAPEISLRDVYNSASNATIDYLGVLTRTAQAQGKTAFLGFCRAGTQMPQVAEMLGGVGVHLWRAPREQFASYGWPTNDYFMAGTLLQLALSQRFSEIAQRLVPRAFALPWLALAKLMPDNQTRTRYRLARRIASTLTAEESYALFYLSWLISFQAASASSELSFSLSELAADSVLRAQVEGRFGITLDTLRSTPDAEIADIGYERIEAEVTARFDGFSGVSTSNAADHFRFQMQA